MCYEKTGVRELENREKKRNIREKEREESRENFFFNVIMS